MNRPGTGETTESYTETARKCLSRPLLRRSNSLSYSEVEPELDLESRDLIPDVGRP